LPEVVLSVLGVQLRKVEFELVLELLRLVGAVSKGSVVTVIVFEGGERFGGEELSRALR
jgi:hypothetical protein